jgi:hypothetical protein
MPAICNNAEILNWAKLSQGVKSQIADERAIDQRTSCTNFFSLAGFVFFSTSLWVIGYRLEYILRISIHAAVTIPKNILYVSICTNVL